MSKPHPSRRAPGSAGRRVRAYSNAFELTWTTKGFVYHYDVAMMPLWDTGRTDFKIGAQKGTELVMRLQEQVEPLKFNPLGAYDGKKNLYSFQKYSFTSEEFTVPWQNGPSRKNVSVKVVFVREINYGSLQRLLAGDGTALNPEGDAVISMNMLNIFVQATPKMQEPRIHNVKSFFTPAYSRPSSVRPLELWRGFFQSVRPTFDRVIVNVDVTVGVVVPAKPLEMICGDYVSVRNTRELSALKQSQFQQLRLFVRGLKVVVDLPGHRGKRPKTIKDLVQNVGAVVFDKGGVPTSIADHFQAMHNIRIPPKSLGVKLGQDGQFPISVCLTVQQLYKNRASPEIVRDALAFSPSTPGERMAIIENGWQQLQYTQSSFLVGAGINVMPMPTVVHGRTLPSPEISFGNNKVHLQRPGVWDVMNKVLSNPAKLEAWTVVNFALAEPRTLQLFVDDLAKTMRERGMGVTQAPNIIDRHAGSDIPRVLYGAAQEAKARLLLVILQESAAHTYREVKRFGDITQGIPTQCVRWSNKLAKDAMNHRCNQYHNNLILKINAKLGGVNYFPISGAMANFTKQRTMVLGADVSHPAPRSLLPSVAALVASMDQHACRYVASIRVQASRVEMIEDIADMFDSALHTFGKINGNNLPQRIVFFRDGVSEGEFAIVRDRELNAMKVPIQKHYGPQKNWPQLVFIVVGKRHHFRFFPDPKSGEGADARGNGNLLPGFVVDQDIVHPIYSDFYLQSQPGLKGTSRPSHYTVLVNGAGMSIDELQQLAYSLCHSYSRSTRSVKIPAPVYYADLVCRRAKFHFEDDVHDIDSDNGTIQSGEGPHIDFYRQRFNAINERMKATMYFV